jgi:polyisoprenoid-binding protein YceI
MKTILVPLVVASLFTAGAACAESWTIDKAQSELGFTATQTGSKFTGHFTRYDATIDFDPAHPEAGHATATIDMTSAVTGDKQRDAMLPDADWFDVAQFPQARFEATRFDAKGGNVYEAVGKLTIRGVTKDVVLPFTLQTANGVTTADGTLPILRSDYGVGQGAWATGQWVGLDVTVMLHVTATPSR